MRRMFGEIASLALTHRLFLFVVHLQINAAVSGKADGVWSKLKLSNSSLPKCTFTQLFLQALEPIMQHQSVVLLFRVVVDVLEPEVGDIRDEVPLDHVGGARRVLPGSAQKEARAPFRHLGVHEPVPVPRCIQR